jgi:hypothetical protein
LVHQPSRMPRSLKVRLVKQSQSMPRALQGLGLPLT